MVYVYILNNFLFPPPPSLSGSNVDHVEENIWVNKTYKSIYGALVMLLINHSLIIIIPFPIPHI